MIETKDGQVYRDGALVGAVDGDKLIVAEKLHHKVQALLERETGLTVVGGAPALPAPTTKEPEPPQDHRGDKTPAYIEWLHRNHPEEAAKRYANRKISRL